MLVFNLLVNCLKLSLCPLSVFPALNHIWVNHRSNHWPSPPKVSALVASVTSSPSPDALSKHLENIPGKPLTFTGLTDSESEQGRTSDAKIKEMEGKRAMERRILWKYNRDREEVLVGEGLKKKCGDCVYCLPETSAELQGPVGLAGLRVTICKKSAVFLYL